MPCKAYSHYLVIFFHNHSRRADLSFLDSKEFELVGIELHSTGLGPAVIKKIDIYFDNRLVSDFNEINEHPSTSQIWKNNKPIGRLPNFGSEVYMPVGMRVPIYTVKSSEINDWDSFQNLIHERIYLRAEVCSVYNDCTSTCLDYDSQC